jgi:hypothetical protein
MPRYFAEVIVDAGSTEADPTERELQLEQQFITDVIVYIDSGAKNLVKVQLLDGDRLLFPYRQSDPFSIPAVSDPAPVQRALPSKRRDVTIRTFAPNAVNDHAVLVAVDALSLEAARAQGLAPEQFDQRRLQVAEDSVGPEDLQEPSEDS